MFLYLWRYSYVLIFVNVVRFRRNFNNSSIKIDLNTFSQWKLVFENRIDFQGHIKILKYINVYGQLILLFQILCILKYIFSLRCTGKHTFRIWVKTKLFFFTRIYKILFRRSHKNFRNCLFITVWRLRFSLNLCTFKYILSFWYLWKIFTIGIKIKLVYLLKFTIKN